MKIRKLICGLLMGLTIFSSCSTDNNNDEPNSTNHLVKREYVSNNVNLEYRYNEDSQLTRIFDIHNQGGIDEEINYTYDSNNVVTKNFQSNNSSYSEITNYSFNGNNRLLNAISTRNNGNIITQEFSYNNNIISVDISSNTGASRLITLEVNSLGLINKMIESQYYAIITYDSNENISKIEIFDNNDDLLDNSEYTYDNKPNPFYGQLKSIYLPIFLDAFIDAYYSEFVWGGYDGYYFPFLKNNITSIMQNGFLYRNYNYTYDNQNYPINVIEEFNTYEFDIEYEQ